MVVCDGEMAKSTIKKKTLNPLYREIFELPVHESEVDTANVELKVYDYDLVGDDDFMCQIIPVPVASLTRKWSAKTWYKLTDEHGQVSQGIAISPAKTRISPATHYFSSVVI